MDHRNILCIPQVSIFINTDLTPIDKTLQKPIIMYGHKHSWVLKTVLKLIKPEISHKKIAPVVFNQQFQYLKKIYIYIYTNNKIFSRYIHLYINICLHFQFPQNQLKSLQFNATLQQSNKNQNKQKNALLNLATKLIYQCIMLQINYMFMFNQTHGTKQYKYSLFLMTKILQLISVELNYVQANSTNKPMKIQQEYLYAKKCINCSTVQYDIFYNSICV
eukprot:TRINITY_DN4372_c1_g1_i1.p2 TRINITY_DN4372_c1_g1~~TRINITY_DN4372_c1_g1_i1.p2  ORF type:complete len:219 (+),score=-30.11 TRINITY_DN4372_c1_g1_i1:487-1143(+)